MSFRSTIALLSAGTVLLGCSDATGPASGAGRLALAVRVTSSLSPTAAAETITLGGHTLVLDRVQLVLREIELERVRGSFDCGSSSSAPAAASGSNGKDDDCEELELGPLLVDLPLNGQIARILTIEADTGTFREIEFDLHKPDDDSARDLAFLQRHPDFRRVSIRVDGTFDGAAFTFLTDLSAELELDLQPPLVIAEAGTVELTLLVDLSAWFLGAGGTTLVDPRTANKGGPMENIVKNNIRASFAAFEEDD